jgi:alkylation response protein AidB-like acyl-CoA dehydrogenase
MIGADGTGFDTAMRTLDHTRITIAAQAVGIAQGALDYALGYVKERKQFGKALAEFQGLQFMLADMGMKLEAARQLTYAAAAKSERATSIYPFLVLPPNVLPLMLRWRSPRTRFNCLVATDTPRISRSSA